MRAPRRKEARRSGARHEPLYNEGSTLTAYMQNRDETKRDRPSVLTRSSSDPEVWYRVEVNARGEGVSCSCPGHSYRQSCRHLSSPGHPAWRAAWGLLSEAGLELVKIDNLWLEARAQRRHPSAQAVRFAYLASQSMEGSK